MKLPFRRILALLLCLGLLIPLSAGVRAVETENTQQEAKDISSTKYIKKCVGFPNYGYFFDGKVLYGGKSNGGEAYFTAEHEEGIGSIYIIFQHEFGAYTVTNNDTGDVATVGEGYFLHEFLDMQELFGTVPTSVTVTFTGQVAHINEIYLFTPGRVPDFVQQWQAPVDNETDLVLFSTHGDDEHLFFAGVLPYYGVERGYQVQVVYLTNHRNNSSIRIHEMLNGLWAIGIDTYPVFGGYDDFRTGDMESAYRSFEALGETREEMLGFVVEQMRRFKPKVVVAHDFNGEYRHGQHMVYADLVAKALEISNNPTQYKETADKYGLWDVPKAYYHLYEENEIVMDWDTPLDSFDGETAFEVSVYRGFQCHETQVRDFAWYYAGFPNALSLTKYNPCYYGLYRTTVGLDVEKNDFFENVTTHAEDHALELERQAQLEQERLEAERKEQERIEREQQQQAQSQAEQEARKEAEKEAAAQKAREEAEQRAREAQARKDRIMYTILLGCGVTLILILLFVLSRELKKGKKKRKKASKKNSKKI